MEIHSDIPAGFFLLFRQFLLFVTRFLFILLGPEGKAHQYHEIGRSMATIMTDEVQYNAGTDYRLFSLAFPCSLSSTKSLSLCPLVEG